MSGNLLLYANDAYCRTHAHGKITGIPSDHWAWILSLLETILKIPFYFLYFLVGRFSRLDELMGRIRVTFPLFFDVSNYCRVLNSVLLGRTAKLANFGKWCRQVKCSALAMNSGVAGLHQRGHVSSNFAK